MKWNEILINFVFTIIGGIISGVIVSFVCNFFIEKRINKREEYKNHLLLSYLFFESFETEMSGFGLDEINNHLVEYRELYDKDDELKEAFHDVYISLRMVINSKKNGNPASYSFKGEDYLNFKNLLESKIKKR